MGVNNRQRRAAKQRKRAKQGTRRPRSGGWQDGEVSGGPDESWYATGLALWAVDEVAGRPAAAAKVAADLLRSDNPVAPRFVAEAVHDIVADMVGDVVRGGWTPTDLTEIVRRQAYTRYLPTLAAFLTAETERHPDDKVAPEWREDLGRLGPAEAPNLRIQAGLECVLGVTAVLRILPPVARVMSPPGAEVASSHRPRTHADHRQLARVRALLAKAESTEYDEEAEALSAKAQELVSRYALDRLLDQPADESYEHAVTARRLWIDAPYVLAKATLVDQVAGANRCRSVVSEQLGFATVIGEPTDLESVDVLATSLLLQAHTAMMRHGRQTDRGGSSRTTSFRRSFLMAYASRIGERLRAATQEATEATGRAEVLLPALRRRAEHVDTAFEETFPDLVERTTSISNGHGWAAGRAAADLAQFDAHPNVTERAG